VCVRRHYFFRCPPIFAATNHSAPKKICFSDVTRPALKRLWSSEMVFSSFSFFNVTAPDDIFIHYLILILIFLKKRVRRK